LYSSTYYALKDTRTPLMYAIWRVALTTILGYLSALPLPRILGIDPRWGVAGLTISAGVSSWVEFTLLRRSLNRRIGQTGLPFMYLVKGWAAALTAAVVARGALMALGQRNHILTAAVILGIYGVGYFGLAMIAGIPEVRSLLGLFSRFTGRA
jgi:putative peptidoglycan lipid II flippase